MDAEETRTARTGRDDHTLVLRAIIAVIGVIVLIILARTAFDLFILLVFAGVITLLRRTAGDWLGEVLGVRGGTVAFAAAVGLAGWWLVGTDGGRNAVGQFFSEAGRLGFNSIIGDGITIPASSGPASSSPASSSPASSSPASSGPASSGPAATPSSGLIAPSRAATPAGGSASSSSSSSRTEPRAAAGNDDRERPVTPSRITLRVTKTAPDRFVLHAMLSGSAGTPEGSVEFSVDGRVVATARVAPDGSAETTVSTSRPGSYRVRVRFAGNSRFGPAVAETTLTI